LARWQAQLAAFEAGQPWLEPWRDVATPVVRAMERGVPLHQALNEQGPQGLQFVPAAEVPAGFAYEQFIDETSRCPTREGLHDFFNGLAWLEFPRSKRQLNRIQAAEIAMQGVGPERGAVRDAATLFDENGAVLSAPEPLWDALRGRDWQRLFVRLRPLWRDARLLLFGHALLEKLLQPRKNLTAHVLDIACPAAPLGTADEWLALQLTAERLGAKPFLPLPVLGIPGWCRENDKVSFYDDPSVFRIRAGLRADAGT
jgi:hypothetical protein